MGTEPPDGVRAGIAAGSRLGRFVIIGPIGAGGMGQVYRAHDPQLGRDVAIKILPRRFWDDPERGRRIEQEARAAASLNHPNVLAVHDFVVHEGVGCIVTELLEGETLRARMGGRALSPRVAVDYAIQIANGLAAGHERGIVHRDIKPENLFVTTDGRIKILDFSLATLDRPPSDAATETMSPETMSAAPIAGTAAYLSPEQARGLRLDRRSDLFSTGVVLYEMLAGFAPFRRATAGETLHAVLHDEPAALKGVAPELARLVNHCLEKSPEQRFQNARDLEFALQSLPPAALVPTARSAGSLANRKIFWTVSVALAVGIAVVIGYYAGERARPQKTKTITPGIQRLTEFAGLEESPSISPDGRSVAFVANVNGQRQIFVRLIAGGTPVQITRDDVDHDLPRWSPDGNELFYFSHPDAGRVEGEVWRLPALGGSPRRVIECLGGADVSREGRLACFRLVNGSVQLVSASLDGSDVKVIAASVPGYHLYPRWSPDQRWIAFQRGDGVRSDIFVIASEGGRPRQLTHDRNIIRGLAWLPDSRGIVYGSARGSTLPYLPPLGLWEVPLDGGEPRRITPVDTWYEQPDIHGSGALYAVRMRMTFNIWQFPFERDPADNVRRATQLTDQSGEVLTPTAAPDGEHVAFLSDSGGHANLWVLSNRGGPLRQITFEEDPAVSVGVPVWSPDGRSIAFVSSKGHTGLEFGIWLVDSDGRNLRNLANRGLGTAWSADGKWVYYTETAAGVLNRVSASDGRTVRVRTEATRNVIGVHGSTLYYTVERVLLDGRPEIEIRAATPESGPSRAVARIAASRVPSWQIVNPSLSPDGEWLAMPLTDGFTTNIWALSTRTGVWRQVTDFGNRSTFIARRVSWSADGKAVLAAVGEGDADIVVLSEVIAPR